MSKRVLIVTGLSGAGRTSALKILEDYGFEAIDNIPFFFFKNIIEMKIKKNLALGIDIRSRDFDAKKIVSLINKKKKDIDVSVIFFDCDNQKLINRYDESRRLHPLKLDLPMEDIIDRERYWLEPLKKISQYYLDTTDLTINLLRKKIKALFQKNIKIKPTVRIISFGYKNGLPREADFVFDMRFLKNPFYVKKLKKLDGRNPEIIKFVKNQGLFLFFFDSMETLINEILNGFNDEGKDYITIAFGCTGGVHRSVVSSEYFHSFLQKNKEIEVFIDHRDLKI
ncbi:MAG: RNase adapter RapZ [Rickettsiales bacterium]|nr:RNase adapter RapZ [Rickettsiales bacterium]RPG14868.1 MAG: RNase adapter RapZ [Pelagibacteraceae bacterium TMED195]|tara:strand:+ start:886 stop:1731 length:846 start_codon:yes stop_codon:yes gene_type:complete